MRIRLPNETDWAEATSVGSAMVQVESEAIEEIGYERSKSVLFVRFAHGGWYSYFGVPGSIYENLIAAESHGRYFHEHIRGRYPYHRGQNATQT